METDRRPSKPNPSCSNSPRHSPTLQAILPFFPTSLAHLIHDYFFDPRFLVATGDDFTIARLPDGTLCGFGSNRSGQLGDGSTTDRYSPIAIPNLREAKGVAAGAQHTIVLMENGTLLGFGQNKYGQLGDGSTTDRLSPVAVPGMHTAEAVACGRYFTIVLLMDGTLHRFGCDLRCKSGYGWVRQWSFPVEVPGLRGECRAVACGAHHTVALMKDGTLRAFGDNRYNQLGDGSTATCRFPIVVPGISTAQAIACGSNHTVVLLKGGAVVTFGSNSAGQLGNGSRTPIHLSHVLVPNIGPARNVACSRRDGTFVLLEDGSVYFCGDEGFFTLSVSNSSPKQRLYFKIDLQHVVAVFSGRFHTIALKRDGTLLASGSNDNGQLGERGITCRRKAEAMTNIKLF